MNTMNTKVISIATRCSIVIFSVRPQLRINGQSIIGEALTVSITAMITHIEMYGSNGVIFLLQILISLYYNDISIWGQRNSKIRLTFTFLLCKMSDKG